MFSLFPSFPPVMYSESVFSRRAVDFDVGGFGFAEAEAVAAEFEFEWVAKWGGAEAADFDARRDAHLEDAAAGFIVADHADHAADLADLKLGQGACHAGTLVRTITRSESSSRKQSLLQPSSRTMQGVPLVRT